MPPVTRSRARASETTAADEEQLQPPAKLRKICKVSGGSAPDAKPAVGIDDLPNEMLQRIFAFVPHGDYGRLMQVSRRFYENALHPALWKHVTLPPSMSDRQLKILAGGWLSRMPVETLRLDRWCLRGECFSRNSLCKLGRACPNLKCLILEDCPVVASTFPFYCFSNIERLTFVKRYGLRGGPPGYLRKHLLPLRNLFSVDFRCRVGMEIGFFSRLESVKEINVTHRFLLIPRCRL